MVKPTGLASGRDLYPSVGIPSLKQILGDKWRKLKLICFEQHIDNNCTINTRG